MIKINGKLYNNEKITIVDGRLFLNGKLSRKTLKDHVVIECDEYYESFNTKKIWCRKVKKPHAPNIYDQVVQDIIDSIGVCQNSELAKVIYNLELDTGQIIEYINHKDELIRSLMAERPLSVIQSIILVLDKSEVVRTTLSGYTIHPEILLLLAQCSPIFEHQFILQNEHIDQKTLDYIINLSKKAINLPNEEKNCVNNLSLVEIARINIKERNAL